jgi:hypothetical protein
MFTLSMTHKDGRYYMIDSKQYESLVIIGDELFKMGYKGHLRDEVYSIITWL